MTPEEQRFKTAILSGNYDQLIKEQAIKPAYSPFDAVTGGIGGIVGQAGRRGTAFLANTLTDPIIEAATQGLASTDNSGLAAIMGRRGTGQLIRNYLSDPTAVPAKFYHGSEKAFKNFKNSERGLNTAAPSSRAAHFGAANPKTAEEYLSSKYQMPEYLQWEKSFPAAKENFAKKHLIETDTQFSNLTSYLNTLPPGSKEYNKVRNDLWAKEDEFVQMMDNNAGVRAEHNKKATRDWERKNQEADKANDNIREFNIDAENPMFHDMGGTDYREESYFNLIQKAKREGHDALVIQNTTDGGPVDDILAFWGDPTRQEVNPYSLRSGVAEEASLVEKLWGKDAVEIAKNTSVLDGM